LTNFIGYITNLSFTQAKNIEYIEDALLAAKDLHTEMKSLEIILNKLIEGDKSVVYFYGLNVPRDAKDIFYALANRKYFAMPETYEVDWVDSETGRTLLHQATIHRRVNLLRAFQSNIDVRDKSGKLPIQYIKEKNVARTYVTFTVKMKENVTDINPVAAAAYFHLKQSCNDILCIKECCRPSLPFTKAFIGFNMEFDPFSELTCNSECPISQGAGVVSITGGGVKVLALLPILSKQSNIDLSKVKTFAGVSAGALLCCMLIQFNFNYTLITNIFYRLLPKLFLNNESFKKCLTLLFGNRTQKTFGKKYNLYILTTKVNRENSRLEREIFYNSDAKLVDILMASCCAPQVFSPIEINGNTYVDGGLLCNNPLNELGNIFQDELILSLVATSDPLISPIPFFPFQEIYNTLNTLTFVKDSIATTYLTEGTLNVLRDRKCKVIQATSEPYRFDSFTTNRDKIFQLVKHYCETVKWHFY
jgi:predicted patatin/cPLA2 family phospholipase